MASIMRHPYGVGTPPRKSSSGPGPCPAREGKYLGKYTTQESGARKFDDRKTKIVLPVFSNCYNQRGKTYLCLENLQKDEFNVNVGCAFVDVEIPDRQNQDTRKIRMCFSRLTSSFDDSNNATKPREQRSEDYIQNIILPAIENTRDMTARYERGTRVEDSMAAVIGTDGAHEMVTTVLSKKIQHQFAEAKISVLPNLTEARHL